jgi:methyltransferase type 11
MDGFSAFVKYYDRLVGADYKKIISFIEKTLKKYKPDSALVADLGCGSGNVAIGLVKCGFDLIALDSSAEMLTLAQQKQIGQNISPKKLLLLCQDMCSFELYGTVDAIYSTLDSINYITDEKQLDHCFKLVNNYLNYGGLFLFDINSFYKYSKVLNNNIFTYDFDDIYCIWENMFDKKSRISNFSLTFFEKEGKLFKRSDNLQCQKYYALSTIKKLLNKNSLEVLGVWDDYSALPPSRTTQRYTILARTIKQPGS